MDKSQRSEYMLSTLEQKKKYIQDSRHKNFRASLRLEGFEISDSAPSLSKSEILQKYTRTAAIQKAE